MSERVDPFAGLKNDPPVFTTKQRTEKAVEEAAVTRLAEENGFPSREAPKAKRPERRKPRLHRTGRNVQFNAKVTDETNTRIYKIADEMSEEKGGPVALGELLKLAMDALERERTVARNIK